jgi:hypothetical protein
MKHTNWRRILVRLREAPTSASSFYAGVGATKEAGEKTSQVVCFETEIALALFQSRQISSRPKDDDRFSGDINVAFLFQGLQDSPGHFSGTADHTS